MVEDEIATVVIDRPERRGALNLDLLGELADAVDAVAGARALILTGTEGNFCAGADLSELEDVSFTRDLGALLRRLAGLPGVTIAAIDGVCFGLGMQLALACDIRVVAPGASFAVPVAKLGLMVDHWTLDRLARFWGEGTARHLVLTGAILDADDAWRLGFAQVRGDRAAALELARSAAALAPLTQSGSKLGFGVHDPEGIGRYEAAFATAWASEDLQEGRAAFLERRPALFRGE